MEEQLSKIVEQLEKLGEPGILSWIAAFGPVLTLCLIVFYIFQFSRNNNRQRNEKAIEYTKEYSEKILNNITYLDRVYGLAKLNITGSLHPYDMKYFDKDEFEILCQQPGFDEVLCGQNFDQVLDKIIKRGKVLALIAERSRLPIYGGARLGPLLNDPDNFDQAILKSALVEDLKLIRSSTLNALEYMAMYFTTQIAAKKVVYNSLHHTYLRGMVYFYCYLANPELSEHDKPYPHVIKLFNMWNQKYFRKEQQRKKREENPFLNWLVDLYLLLRFRRRRKKFRKRRPHYSYRIK